MDEFSNNEYGGLIHGWAYTQVGLYSEVYGMG